MKNLYFFTLLIFLYSCTEDKVLVDLPQNDPLQEISQVETIKSFIRMTHSPKTTRTGAEENEIVPYVIDGDTTIFVVNYRPGWQIFSNCVYAPLLLASSDFGTLDIDLEIKSETPLGLHIQSLANDIHSINFSVPDSLRRPNEPDSLRFPISGERQYFYEIDTISIEQQEHLLLTTWGNNEPWNVYTRYVGNQHSQVGCAAIAVGQYLFYEHYINGFPESTYSLAIPPVENDTVFSFDNLSSSIWDKMAIDRYGYSTDSVAVFLASISESISSTFGTNGTYAYPTTYQQYLRNQGFSFDYVNIDYDYIINSLKLQEPVILSIFTRSHAGHALIADSYRIETLQVTSAVMGVDGPYTVTNTCENKYIRMNWGWDGISDDIWFVASNSADWLTLYSNPSGTYSNQILFENTGIRKMFKINNQNNN